MDPIAGVALVGVGYLAVSKTAVLPTRSQPESVGDTRGPVIPSLPPPRAPVGSGSKNGDKDLLAGGGIGGAFGAILGMGLLELTKNYDAPVSKSLVVPVMVGLGVIAGVYVASVGVAAALSGPFVVVVFVVAAVVFMIFVIAIVAEDNARRVGRWNEFASVKQVVVKAVAEGNYWHALRVANAGAKQGIPGLGFSLSTDYRTLYPMGAFYRKTAINFESNEVNRNMMHPNYDAYLKSDGLDRDYFYPTFTAYDYDSYFGKDGAEHEMLSINSTSVDVKKHLKGLFEAQKAAYYFLANNLAQQQWKLDNAGLKKAMPTNLPSKLPTWKQWLEFADRATAPDGSTLRQLIAAHDAFGKKLSEVCIWIPRWALQSPMFPMDPSDPRPVSHDPRYWQVGDKESLAVDGIVSF